MIDFNIIVNTAKAGVSKAGFGRIAVLSTEVTQEYTILNSLKDLEIAKETETYKIIQTIFSQKPAPKEVILIGEETSTADDILTSLLEQTDDFFFIVTDSPTLILAKTVETMDKMLFTTVRDLDTINSLEGLGNTVAFYHKEEGEYPAEALAVIMSYDVGSKSAHFKQLAGVKATQIDSTTIDLILDLGANLYVTKKGENQVTGGTTMDSQWIDVTLGAYWIKFTVDERVMYLALNENKIPYNNRGVGMLAGVVGTVMAEAIERDILDDYIIEYKDVTEISAQEKASRIYNYLVATGQLTGAIHGGDITINLVYEEVA